MKTFRTCFINAVLILLLHQVSAQTSSYQKEIDAWHSERIQELKAPTGWINLAGLFWLKPGKNSFGSAAGNDIVFQHPNMPATAGYFEVVDSTVTWVTEPGVTVLQKESAVSKMLVFEKGKFPPLLALKNFRWNIIKRDDKIGVRFRDLESERVKNFTGVERYPVDSSWRIPAHLETIRNSFVSITNVLGQVNSLTTPGKLVFTIGKTTYRLDALEDSPEELLIVFGDATSAKDTYPSGRFVYIKRPGIDGNTYIDFNKAQNPPCAFTNFATCPLPPKQNILPVAIKAGEKYKQ